MSWCLSGEVGRWQPDLQRKAPLKEPPAFRSFSGNLVLVVSFLAYVYSVIGSRYLLSLTPTYLPASSAPAIISSHLILSLVSLASSIPFLLLGNWWLTSLTSATWHQNRQHQVSPCLSLYQLIELLQPYRKSSIPLPNTPLPCVNMIFGSPYRPDIPAIAFLDIYVFAMASESRRVYVCSDT